MSLPADDIEKQVDERLKKLARSVRMPGFRPGKVPLKLVAQTYGPQVRSEVLSDAVQKSFSDAVKEANLKVAGYPQIERKDGDGASSSARPSRSIPRSRSATWPARPSSARRSRSTMPRSTRRSRSCASSARSSSRCERAGAGRRPPDGRFPRARSTASRSRAARRRTSRSPWAKAACCRSSRPRRAACRRASRRPSSSSFPPTTTARKWPERQPPSP